MLILARPEGQAPRASSREPREKRREAWETLPMPLESQLSVSYWASALLLASW